MFGFLQKLTSQRRWSTILLGLLSATKIITDMVGYHIISNHEVNGIVNGAAALGTVITVMMSHMKTPLAPSPNVNSGPSNVTLLGATNQSRAVAGDAITPSLRQSIHPQCASNGYARPPQT